MAIYANKKISRRQFVSQVTGAAAFTIIPRHVLGGTGFAAPSEKLNIAVVGCGGQGRTNIRGLMQHKDAQVVAIADPTTSADYDRFYYKGLAGRLPVKEMIEKHYQAENPKFKCNDYNDFRMLFGKEKDIDAVLCATPDHWHAYVAMTAMKLGKHVYCEKPLAHNIWEVRQLAKAARETKVATQMGNHGRSSSGHPLMREWLADGAIGNVKEVQAWSNASAHIHHKGRPAETMEVPKGLDWKMWLGPRGPRPYNLEYMPYTWRNWWAFGSGIMGDMSIHHFDSAWMALNLGDPTWIEGNTEQLDNETASENNKVTWMFEKTDTRQAVKFFWCDGKLKPDRPAELEENRNIGGNGVIVIGDKGKILGGGWSASPRIIPEVKMKEYKRPAKTLPRSTGHHRNWLDACKNGGSTVSNFEYAAKLTEFVLLGNLAIRAGKRIYWDAEEMKAKGMGELDPIIREAYIPEWDLAKLL
ncbi:MAG: Gfo/Idh/MocA family oxidoreductase [Phycisphaerae bacterium]|nr:Gfo/Idh/MocA family oxidoreductase [Phycisphaerae bacterium]